MFAGMGVARMTVDELAAVRSDDFEWAAEVERLLVVARAGGRCGWAVRVRYRRRSTRSNSQRWVRFLLVPAADDSFDELAEKIEPAIVEHFRRGARVVGVSTRRLLEPRIELEVYDEEHVLVRAVVPGTKWGTVELVLEDAAVVELERSRSRLRFDDDIQART